MIGEKLIFTYIWAYISIKKLVSVCQKVDFYQFDDWGALYFSQHLFELKKRAYYLKKQKPGYQVSLKYPLIWVYYICQKSKRSG